MCLCYQCFNKIVWIKLLFTFISRLIDSCLTSRKKSINYSILFMMFTNNKSYSKKVVLGGVCGQMCLIDTYNRGYWYHSIVFFL